jgi:hypothetical protein
LIFFLTHSCTPTRSSKFAPKSYIKSNCNVRHWSKCGASRWRQNLLKMLTVKMNYVVMSAAWKTRVSLCKTVRGKSPFNHIKFLLGTDFLFFLLLLFLPLLEHSGIIKGDEIIVINGAIVSDLDMMYLESVLQEEQALCMMMR